MCYKGVHMSELLFRLTVSPMNDVKKLEKISKIKFLISKLISKIRTMPDSNYSKVN